MDKNKGTTVPSRTKSEYSSQIQSNDELLNKGSLSSSSPAEATSSEVAPTGVRFSSRSIDENAAAGTVVGVVSVSDVDSSAHSFAFVDTFGNPAPHELFELQGNKIVVKDGAIINFEAATSHDLILQVTDPDGNAYTEPFNIDVNDVNEGVANLSFAYDEQGGLQAEYFNIGRYTTTLDNVDFTRPADAIKTLDDLTFGNGDNTVWQNDGGINDYFAARISGEIQIEEAGEWSFGVNADDGVIILIDGEIVVDDRQLHDARFSEGSINLSAGSHSLEVMYFENRGDTALDIVWKAPSASTYEPVNGDRLTFTTHSVGENAQGGFVVGRLAADSDVTSYQITGGASDLFTLEGGNKIVVKEGITLNYEAATSHEIQVLAYDENGNANIGSVIIDVRDVNEAPHDLDFSGVFTVAENVGGGIVVASVSSVSDQDADETHSYSIIGDAAAQFYVNDKNEIATREGANLDFEASPTIEVDVQAVDRAGNVYVEAITIDLTNVNEAPTEIILTPSFAGSDLTIDENANAGTRIAKIWVNDKDAGDIQTIEFIDNDGNVFDHPYLAINAQNYLVVKDGAVIDFETLETLDLTLRTSDEAGESFSQAFSIAVNDLEDTGDLDVEPFTLNVTGNNVGENAYRGTLVSTVNIVDGDWRDYSIELSGEDAGNFVISGNQIRTKDGSVIDFETSGGIARVVVTVTDASGASTAQALGININDLNEKPIEIDPSIADIYEGAGGGTLVATLTTVDPDLNDTFNYQIVGYNGLPEEHAFLEIVGDQVLVKDGVDIDFETTPQLGIRVKVTDSGGKYLVQQLSINVKNLDENPAPTDITFSARDVNENTYQGTRVATLSTTDANQNADHVYEISGNGAEIFEVSRNSLILREGIELDFETTSTIDFTITVTDAGGRTYSEDVTFSINDLNEGPLEVVSSLNRVTENAAAGTVVAQLSTIDHDADDTFTYEIVDYNGNATKHDFIELSDGGELIVKEGVEIDFEATKELGLIIKVTDSGGESIQQRIVVNVENVNEGASGVRLLTPYIVEGTAGGTVISRIAAIDPDGQDTYSFELVGENDKLEVREQFIFTKPDAKFDFGRADEVTAQIRVTNDTTGDSLVDQVSISLRNLNDAPTDIRLSRYDIDENSTGAFAELSTTDPDQGDAFTYKISGGDEDLFEIVDSTLHIKESAILDFESARFHDVEVMVTDNGGKSYMESLRINVNDISEPSINTPLIADGGTDLAF